MPASATRYRLTVNVSPAPPPPAAVVPRASVSPVMLS